MPDQETHGIFSPGAWNVIKSARLSEDEQELLRLMIETKTITQDEAKSLLYAVVRG